MDANILVCPEGYEKISVEYGVDSCAKSPICSGNVEINLYRTLGNCPLGTFCGIVKSGVLGCKFSSTNIEKIIDNSKFIKNVSCSGNFATHQRKIN